MKNGASLDAARAAKKKAAKAFEGCGEVVGVGIVSIGDGYGVKVNLADAPAAGSSPPTEVDGVPIKHEVVGTIKKQ
jgi:hypothetical protein